MTPLAFLGRGAEGNPTAVLVDAEAVNLSVSCAAWEDVRGAAAAPPSAASFADVNVSAASMPSSSDSDDSFRASSLVCPFWMYLKCTKKNLDPKRGGH